MFWERLLEMVSRHKELRIAEGFQGANTYYHALSCAFRGINLPIKLISFK